MKKMKIVKNILSAICLVLVLTQCTSEKAVPKEPVKLEFVPYNQVKLTDEFWMPRLKIQKDTLVPFALDKTKPAVDNLKKAADYLKGDSLDLPFPHRYISSDLYKVMEGAALLLRENPDPELEKRMDSIIDIIASAQINDGYLYVSHITGVSKDHAAWGGGGMGDKPYSWVLHSHELYNMGHMYEAAIAYYRSTGKDKWLKVAEKNAQHINKVFFEGDPNYNDGKPVEQAPGHQELELALVKLYRVTGKELYLQMAKKFLDIRGRTFKPEGEGVMSPTYSQQHQPVAEQREAVGHAVRAMYQYSGMADVSAETGTIEYDVALNSIWNDITDTKMHITGGLGAIHGIEGFGPSYVLPNKEAYNETCAAVGNVFFNNRMFLKTHEAKYMDVAEVALLNNSLAGVNLDGNRFFYVNPLESDGVTPFNHGKTGRSPWFRTACCPSNIARLVPQVAGMIYAHGEDNLYVTYFASSSTSVPLANGTVQIQQESDYPFDGHIKLQLNPSKKQRFTLRLRLPTWTTSQFVPGDLYDYTDKVASNWTIKINGREADYPVLKGFVTVDRMWSPEDRVALELPMPVRLNTALESVAANRGRIAVTRGPLVYCAEGTDQGRPVQLFALDTVQKNVQVDKIDSGKLKNMISLRLDGKIVDNGMVEDKDIMMIPYYAWNNRGDSSMMVWFPTNPTSVSYQDGKVLKGGRYKGVEASSTAIHTDLAAISNGLRPMASNDRSVPMWASNGNGKPQWVRIGLDPNKFIQSIKVYWADKIAGTALPNNWHIEYLKDGQWAAMELYVTDTYGLERDQYNVVHPDRPLQCEAIRINMVPQAEKEIGILDVDITYETQSGS
ncbi:MAG: glycoside hydrolase family 127 protein [Flagellimonas sp.]